MITLYGIPNCDTMKKARKWLAEQGVDYQFHDFKKQGLTRKQLETWEKAVGWETLLNRRGMMWRKVPKEIQVSVDKAKALDLLMETPSMIKRPVLDLDGNIHVGFKAEDYEQLF